MSPARLESDNTRFAVIVTRQVGGAVIRNLLKRRLRACVQKYTAEITPGHAVILIARKPMINAQFEDIHNALSGLLKQAGLIRNKV